MMSVVGAGSDSCVAEFLAVESTPAFGKVLPFAGWCGNGSLGRFVRTEGISSPPDEGMTTG